MRVTFVVLHYENLSATINCIKSLEKYLCIKDVSVVIVDNGSRKQKLSDIESTIQRENIYIKRSEKNLGFARGNNIGFVFAKKVLDSDIIVLANNDIKFEQKDLIKKLRNRFEAGFGVAGPKIISAKTKENSNPVPMIYKNKLDVLKRIFKFTVMYLFSYIGIDVRLKRIFKTVHKIKQIDNLEDFQLHGACLIFSGEYIEKFDGLYDKTFMYGEESILKYITKVSNIKMKYFDDIYVSHEEGASTEILFQRKQQQRRFFYKWNIHSCILLFRLMTKEDVFF